MLLQSRSDVVNWNVPAALVPMKLPTMRLLRAAAPWITIARMLNIERPRTTLFGEVMKRPKKASVAPVPWICTMIRALSASWLVLTEAPGWV